MLTQQGEPLSLVELIPMGRNQIAVIEVVNLKPSSWCDDCFLAIIV